MKKFLGLIVALVLCVVSGFSLFGCGETPEVIHIYMPDGAPALSMAKLMHDNNQFGGKVEYTVVRATDISQCIIQQTADVAVLPVNAASKLIATGEKYKMIATVTHGNVYIVGNKDISSLSDLVGERVGIIGAGMVPDLTLSYLLSSQDIAIERELVDSDNAGKVTLCDCVDATTLIQKLMQGQLSFGLLPEPAVSTLLAKPANFNIELNIQALWQGGSYPQAVMVAKTSLCQNVEFINGLINAMIDNEEWILANTVDAVNAITSHVLENVTPSLKTDITSTAIANCNIKVNRMTTTEIANVKEYLNAIKTINPMAVGNYTDAMFYAV
jgi:NitT/TauT family transport system substrate-binding protein